MVTPDELIKYYVNLLILQYKEKPRASQTIYDFVSQYIADNVALKVLNGFDVDTAVGKQLDILAKYVGAERAQVGFNLDRNFFNFADYNDSSYLLYGWDDYENVGAFAQGAWVDYTTIDIASFSLTDEELRLIIKMLIIRNNNNASTKTITELIFNAFNGQIKVVDNKDMTITYSIPKSMSTAASVLAYRDYLPRPMGVKANIVYV